MESRTAYIVYGCDVESYVPVAVYLSFGRANAFLGEIIGYIVSNPRPEPPVLAATLSPMPPVRESSCTIMTLPQ